MGNDPTGGFLSGDQSLGSFHFSYRTSMPSAMSIDFQGSSAFVVLQYLRRAWPSLQRPALLVDTFEGFSSPQAERSGAWLGGRSGWQKAAQRGLRYLKEGPPRPFLCFCSPCRWHFTFWVFQSGSGFTWASVANHRRVVQRLVAQVGRVFSLPESAPGKAVAMLSTETSSCDLGESRVGRKMCFNRFAET